MFKRKTVLVIGAGCSFEYGLPVGDDLKTKIVARMGRLANARVGADDPDMLLVHAATALGEKDGGDALGPWLTAAGEIARGLPHTSSIDRYLHFRSDDQRIVRLGKFSIVRSILEAEKESSLATTPLNQALISERNRNAPHWIGQLFNRMQEGIQTKEKIADIFENLTFISFNYDRCISHYFYNAILELGSFLPDQAAEAMNSLQIFYPYGSVGALPWENDVAGKLKVGFGADLDTSKQLITLAGGIKTYTEGEHEKILLTRIHDSIMDADQIVFLGFSFLDQNMTLLTPPKRSHASYVFGTSFGVSDGDKK